MSYYQCEKCGYVPPFPMHCTQCGGNYCMVYKDEIKQQRDDLLKACKEAAATFVGLVEGSIGGQAMLKINQAITKAEGKK